MVKVIKKILMAILVVGLLLRAFHWDPFGILNWSWDPFGILNWLWEWFLWVVTGVADFFSGNSTFREVTRAPSVIDLWFS